MVTLIDVFVYDLPILVFTLGEFLSLFLTGFIGFTLGISTVHGWPRKTSEVYDLVPMIGREEE